MTGQNKFLLIILIVIFMCSALCLGYDQKFSLIDTQELANQIADRSSANQKSTVKAFLLSGFVPELVNYMSDQTKDLLS